MVAASARHCCLGLLRAGRQAKDLVVAERIPDRAKYLADTYSVLVTSSVTDAVDNATFIVVAVKPADVESVMAELAQAAANADNDSAEQVFVTVAAGITITYFESRLPAGTPVIRAMPNAAALVGAGVTALAKGRFVTRATARGGLGPVRRGRRRAHRSRVANGRGDRTVGFGPGVFLFAGRGPGGRRRRGGSEPSGGHRPDRPDNGRVGGDAAGTDGPGPADRPKARRWGCRRTRRRRNCGRRSPRPAVPPPLRCENSNEGVCGRPWTRPFRPPKAALSS